MDPLTHAIAGGALARALPRKPLPPRLVLWIVLLAMVPDADFVLQWFSDAIYLRHHRGVTHSLLLLPLWTWLIHSLGSRCRHRHPALPWLIAFALATHILLDLITPFGTMIWAPLSDRRFAWDLVFIIDPWFTGAMLVPLLAAFLWPRRGRMLAILSLLAAVGYLGLAMFNHAQALQLVRKAQPHAEQYAALPMPFSPFHWRLIAAFPDHYRHASLDLAPNHSGLETCFPEAFVRQLLGPIAPADKLQWLRSRRIGPAAARLPGMGFYQWFARFPVLLERSREQLEFGDLRFGAGIPGARPPFRLRITRLEGKPQAWLVWREDRLTALR